jgi:molybdopterin-guanine dinucleotide biosynthesis protein A
VTGPTVGAIVLAGGRSQRFGRDKLAETIAGRPLLDHAIAAAGVIAAQIVVVAPADRTPAVPDGVVVVHDERPFEGPLAGLAGGLRAATADHVLVIGGDMPLLVRAVAVALMDEVRSGASAAVLEQARRARPLPMALVRNDALRAAADLLATGERRLRALSEALEAVVIPEPAWRAFDPDGRSVLDIDTPGDLP